MIYKINFNNGSDAEAVSKQIKENHIVEDNQIIFDLVSAPDYQAIELAASLLEIGYYFNDKNFCNLSHKNDSEWQLRECTDPNSLKIYVRCLAAYNHSYLHGMWIDCCQEESEIYSDIEFMLSWSPVRYLECCEEWAIHDTDNWGEIEISEYEDLEYISNLANKIWEKGDAYIAYLSYFGEDCEDFEEKYLGEYDSIEDYAYEYLEQTGMFNNVDGIFERYFNYAAFARDLELGGDITIINNHVFSCI